MVRWILRRIFYSLTEIAVKENKVGILRVGNINYISLTDLARYQNSSDPSFTVKNRLRRINTIDYIGLWEEIHNQDFNLVEFDQIKTEYGRNSFAMSPTQWIKRTNAIGIISKGGRYIGTYGHPDIAFEFASWLSPEFKLYLITEFERLKANEAYQEKIDWQANRILAKLNYVVHTDAVKAYIVPTLTDAQKKFVYAEEANVPQSERLIRLNNSTRRQMKVLKGNKNIKKLELLQKQVNEDNKLITN